MNRRTSQLVALVVTAVAVIACGPVGSSAEPSLAPATYDDFSAGLCRSFTSLIRAVGNPDTGSPSVMSKALDDAVAAGDRAAAERAAAAMLTELETGRQHAALASRWQPGAAAMGHMDRLLVAFEASTAAKREAAAKVPGVDPQKAFEAAGGVEAWTGMLQGISTVPIPAGASPQPCRAFSGQL